MSLIMPSRRRFFSMLAAPAIISITGKVQAALLAPEPDLYTVEFMVTPGSIHQFRGKILRHAVPIWGRDVSGVSISRRWVPCPPRSST